MQNFLKGFVLMLSVFFLLNCSSSSSSSPDDPTPTTDEDLATFIKWVGHAWDDVVASLDASKNFDLDLPVACEGGGTLDLEGSEITINDCVETDGGATYTARGTYAVTESGSLTTHEWEQDVIVDDDI